MICGEGFYYDRVGVDQQPWQGLLHEYKKYNKYNRAEIIIQVEEQVNQIIRNLLTYLVCKMFAYLLISFILVTPTCCRSSVLYTVSCRMVCLMAADSKCLHQGFLYRNSGQVQVSETVSYLIAESRQRLRSSIAPPYDRTRPNLEDVRKLLILFTDI